MKNKFFAMMLIAMGLATAGNAQNAETESTTRAYARIMTPVTITKGSDLYFGSILRGTSAGTVVLAPSGTLTPNNVTLYAGSNAMLTSAAEYTISGEDGSGYSITLPVDGAVVLNDGSGNTMFLTAFTHNASGVFGFAPETFQVGATLNVGANQVAGNYVSDVFDVTVAYN